MDNTDALITALCAAFFEERSAIASAHELAMRFPKPYSEDHYRQFCDAGDRMLAAWKAKVNALAALRPSATDADDVQRASE